MSQTHITLTPYLNFPGTCEEALNTYSKILEGKVEIIQRYDNPAMQAPESYKNKVLHARFSFNGIDIYASDTFPGQQVNTKDSNVSLSLSYTNPETAKKVFSLLAENATIGVPFEKQFWGAWHGNLVDRFGIHWMVNVE